LPLLRREVALAVLTGISRRAAEAARALQAIVRDSPSPRQRRKRHQESRCATAALRDAPKLTRSTMNVTFADLLRPIALVSAVAALVLAAAGCGSSSKSSTTTSSAATAATTTASAPATPTLSKTEFVAKANAICNASNGPLAATALKLASHPSPAEAERIIAGTFIPEIKSQLTQIKALGVPAGGAATTALMDRLLADDVRKIEKNPALAGPAVFHDFAKVAHGYGLTACAPLS
jgi:hypothetical protein